MALFAAMACLPGNAGAEPTVVRFPSALTAPTPFAATRKSTAEPPAVLTGRLYRPVETGSVPALVVLPGCSGAFEPEVEARLASRFLERVIAILVVDSLQSRQLYPQCLWDVGEADRLADAYGALDFLAARQGIDPRRIAVMGFGKAGGTALLAVATEPPAALISTHHFAGAVAFYPRCSPQHGNLDVPALIVIGAKDETSPAHWCRALPRRARAEGPGAPEYLELPGVGHGFDLAGASDPAGRGWGQPDPVFDAAADAAADAAVGRFLARLFGG